MPRHRPAHLQSYRAYQEHKRVIRMTNTEPEAEENRPRSDSEENRPRSDPDHSHNNMA